MQLGKYFHFQNNKRFNRSFLKIREKEEDTEQVNKDRSHISLLKEYKYQSISLIGKTLRQTLLANMTNLIKLKTLRQNLYEKIYVFLKIRVSGKNVVIKFYQKSPKSYKNFYYTIYRRDYDSMFFECVI